MFKRRLAGIKSEKRSMVSESVTGSERNKDVENLFMSY